MSATIATLLQSAATAFDAGNYVDAQNQCHKILQSDRDNIGATELLGMIALRSNVPYLAVEMFEKIAAKGVNSANLHNNLGEAWRLSGDNQKAEAHYRKALKLQRDFPHALNNLGTIHMALGRLDAAKIAFQKAARLDPNMVDATNNLGNVYFAQGDDAMAQKFYLKALAQNPKFVSAINNLGVVAMRQGDFDTAINHFSKALAIQPGFEDAKQNIARIRDNTKALRFTNS
jgi:Tfp pilus assembly protein PilF